MKKLHRTLAVILAMGVAIPTLPPFTTSAKAGIFDKFKRKAAGAKSKLTKAKTQAAESLGVGHGPRALMGRIRREENNLRQSENGLFAARDMPSFIYYMSAVTISYALIAKYHKQLGDYYAHSMTDLMGAKKYYLKSLDFIKKARAKEEEFHARMNQKAHWLRPNDSYYMQERENEMDKYLALLENIEHEMTQHLHYMSPPKTSRGLHRGGEFPGGHGFGSEKELPFGGDEDHAFGDDGGGEHPFGGKGDSFGGGEDHAFGDEGGGDHPFGDDDDPFSSPAFGKGGAKGQHSSSLSSEMDRGPAKASSSIGPKPPLMRGPQQMARPQGIPQGQAMRHPMARPHAPGPQTARRPQAGNDHGMWTVMPHNIQREITGKVQARASSPQQGLFGQHRWEEWNPSD